ncbi:hypothetical protein P7C73_g3164, partial [Tremellales sp. Uapishka_1]
MASSPKLNGDARKVLDTYLRDTVQGHDVPALHFGVTSADDIIYFNQAGDRVFGEPDMGQVDQDTTLELFSMTKFVTTVACLIAIDRGLISLDSEELIEKYLPELGKLEILEGYTEDGQPILRPAQTKITLKMLMSHNSGLSYNFSSPDILRWRAENKVPHMLGPGVTFETLIQPLVFEPGSAWKYSIGLDWAGELLVRVTGQSLETFYKENIFDPCGAHSLSFYPNEDIMARKQAVCTRDSDGKIELLKGTAMGRTLDASAVGPFLAGGAGLFGTARDYLLILQHVLKCSPHNPHPPTKPLFAASSFDLLFKHACVEGTPEKPVTSKADMAKMAAGQTYHDPAHLADEGALVGHSIGLFLNLADSKNGRKAGSGTWDGAAKTQFWIDPSSGLAGVCCTNLLAPNPDYFMKVYNSFERKVYDGLEASK